MKWIRKLFNINNEVDELNQEIEKLIDNAEDIFDLNIIWGKMIVFAEIEKYPNDKSRLFRAKANLKEAEINKKQVEAFKNKKDR